MVERPQGTVTFLFTDIVGSTELVRRLGERYADLLGEHRQLLRAVFSEHERLGDRHPRRCLLRRLRPGQGLGPCRRRFTALAY
jgi:hypothetical protein